MEAARRSTRPRGSKAPVQWSAEIWEQILVALRTGAPRSCSAGYVGVSATTFYSWVNESEELKEEVERAEAIAHLTIYGELRQGLGGNPAIALKVMERRWPDEWRERSEVKVEIEDDGSLDEVRRRLEQLAITAATQLAEDPEDPEAGESAT